MIRKILLHTFIVSISLIALNAQAQKDKNALKYAQTITEEDLKRHLSVIASDSLEGRETGKPGQKKAAKYISEHFANIGLSAPVSTDNGMSYYQEFKVVERTWKEVFMIVNGVRKEFLKDFYLLGTSTMDSETMLEVVFGGAGTDAILESLEIRGKAVMIICAKDESALKVKKARELGAKTVLALINANQNEFENEMNYNAYYLKRGIKTLSGASKKESSVFFLAPETAGTLFNLSTADLLAKINEPQNVPSQSIVIKAVTSEKVILASENVLGFLEGTDKKDEILIITAHYDHIGVNSNGEVNNGADDDGSGTVSVMEIAEAFSKAAADGIKPRRSILFMTVAGEEMGLYGSQYYTDFDPIFPLSQTVADLNIDMVGRKDKKYEKNPEYIYLIGSDKLSTELHELSESTNKTYTNLELDYTYNDENDPNRFYYRSDHYNFAKNKIPIIFYFNGVHEDYHQPTDEIHKILFPKMSKIAQLVFYTAWEIANKDQRLIVDKDK